MRREIVRPAFEFRVVEDRNQHAFQKRGLDKEIQRRGGVGHVNRADAAVGEILLGEEIGGAVRRGDELVGGDGLAVGDGAEGGVVAATDFFRVAEKLLVKRFAFRGDLRKLRFRGVEHGGEGEAVAPPVGDKFLVEIFDAEDVVICGDDMEVRGCVGGDLQRRGGRGGDDARTAVRIAGFETVVRRKLAIVAEGVAHLVTAAEGGDEFRGFREAEIEVAPFDAEIVADAAEHVRAGGREAEQVHGGDLVAAAERGILCVVHADFAAEIDIGLDIMGLAVDGSDVVADICDRAGQDVQLLREGGREECERQFNAVRFERIDGAGGENGDGGLRQFVEAARITKIAVWLAVNADDAADFVVGASPVLCP